MATKKKAKPVWPYDPRLKELVEAFSKMVEIVKKPYAVGGALAMASYGYKRHTDDLDAFLLESNRIAWLSAARKVGLHVMEVFDRVHYMAFLKKHADPDIHIDLLFPHSDPDLSAVEDSAPGKIGEFSLQLWQPKYLGAAKFISTREKDQTDFGAMMNLGLLDVGEVHFILTHVEPDAVPKLVRYMKNLNAPQFRPDPAARLGLKKRGRLPRKT